MINTNTNDSLTKNTTHKVVLPFYLYAALSFLAATLFLFYSTSAFTQHYFHPQTLAITHLMALGWGTMMILGASHQLVPVLIEGQLYSNKLAYTSFVLAAVGIPLLVYGFYVFNMGWPAKWGGRFVLLSILCYLINLAVSISKSKKENIHAIFVFTAAVWLFITAFLGLMLVYNFTYLFLSEESIKYLPLHAHLGIIGWFLMLVIGVGSRLIPMFLISKYSNTKLLWVIYALINGSMATFIFLFLYFPETSYYFIPVAAILSAVVLFGYYCYSSFKQRIRNQVDEQLKISLLAVTMMVLPLIFLVVIIGWLMLNDLNNPMIIMYGFVVFFGWITAMIFGMTFKTLPFIVWNKVYHLQAGVSKTPNPKDLFSNTVFKVMGLVYLAGFVLFIFGIFTTNTFLLKFSSLLLITAALLYNWNVIKIVFHKSTNP